MNNQDLDWLAAQRPQRIEADPAARARALTTLVRHTAANSGGRIGLGRGFRVRMFGLGTAAGFAAVAAALVLMANDGTQPARNGYVSHGDQTSQTSVRHLAGKSPLTRLADYVSESTTPAGNATVVARTTAGATGGSVTVYDLYADNGQYFFSQTESGLAGQVSAHNNLAGGLFAREIAAAKLAATGNVQTAAQDLADAPDPSHVVSPTQTVNPAAVAEKERLTGVPQEGNLFDNWVWEDAQDALIAGSGDPEVRAGVLRILATLPGVTVTQSTSGNQPTLVLAAGSPEVGYDYTEQLTINADTGVPIQFIGGPAGGPPTATVTYEVSRVTFAGLPSDTASSSS